MLQRGSDLCLWPKDPAGRRNDAAHLPLRLCRGYLAAPSPCPADAGDRERAERTEGVRGLRVQNSFTPDSSNDVHHLIRFHFAKRDDTLNAALDRLSELELTRERRATKIDMNKNGELMEQREQNQTCLNSAESRQKSTKGQIRSGQISGLNLVYYE